jgi:parallel beta-helix repeat protein/predicted outer membrane repeat protein
MSEQGAAATTIDGNQSGSVVTCQNDEGPDSVLEGFTIFNGQSWGGGGMYLGGYMISGNPTVSNCIFKDNTAEGDGAGIYMYYSSPTITNCSFLNNSASFFGGGILNYYSSPMVINCSFDGNEAGQAGGGMYIENGNPLVINCTFSNNTSVVAGGMYYTHYWSRDRTVKITNCTFKGNSADYGGGIFSAYAYSTETNLTNCIFAANTAVYHGGGMYINYGWQTDFTNNTFVNNSAGERGGGIYIFSGNEITFTNTILWEDNAPQGPEMYLDDDDSYADIAISHCDVMGGEDSVHLEPGYKLNWGKGMMDADPKFLDPLNDDYHIAHISPCRDAGDNTTVVETTDFDGDPRIANDVVDMGADEFYKYLRVPDTYSTIQQAIDAAPEGHGVLVAPGTYMENIDFMGKAILVEGAHGSEMSEIDGAQAGSVVTFQSGEGEDSLLEGFTIRNGASLAGGGIYCMNASPSINDVKITENSSTGAGGGGLYCAGSSPVVEKSVISSNTCTGSGGGVYCNYGSPVMKNTCLQQNSASTGGGIFTDPGSAPIVTNCVVYDNSAISEGGGIHCLAGNPTITNSIVWNNSAPVDPQICAGRSPAITYCDVQGGWPGTGNIDSDPLFKDPAAGDFHLDDGSPCQDAGDNNALELPQWDFERDPRIIYFVVDMGLDENQGGMTFLVPTDIPLIQEAIDAVFDGDTVMVESGVYYEHIDFKGKAITLKSAEGTDYTFLDGSNSYRVVTFNNEEDQDSILEGFTIGNGDGGIYCDHANPTIRDNVIMDNHGSGIYCTHSFPRVESTVISGNRNSSGGGMYNYESSPIITNCSFIDNEAIRWGGGIYNEYYSSPIVTNCLFSGNMVTGLNSGKSARWFGGAGMYGDWYCSPIVTDCTFLKNATNSVGGGMYNYRQCNATVTNCLFSQNVASSSGGMENEGSSPTVTNCIFYQNHAQNSGGGLRDYWLSSSTITNCFFYRNWSNEHGGAGIAIIFSDTAIRNCTFSENTTLGIYAGGGGMQVTSDSEPTIVNSIFWNNHGPGHEIWIGSGPVVTMAFCDVKGGQADVHIEPGGVLYWGAGMIDADPLFVHPPGNDFHLTFDSPCKDAGDIFSVEELYDFEGDPRIAHEIVDMGADEFYTHLYCTGNFKPGGNMKGNFVGLPGTSPVGLFLGFGVIDPPLPTAWGNFHLEAPWVLIPLVPIPGNGVLVLPATIPASPAAPYDVPMQALIGLGPDSLTNLYVLEVR